LPAVLVPDLPVGLTLPLHAWTTTVVILLLLLLLLLGQVGLLSLQVIHDGWGEGERAARRLWLYVGGLHDGRVVAVISGNGIVLLLLLLVVVVTVVVGR